MFITPANPARPVRSTRPAKAHRDPQEASDLTPVDRVFVSHEGQMPQRPHCLHAIVFPGSDKRLVLAGSVRQIHRRVFGR